jgi:DNA repair exonuclease SbcCD ATPase subunit
MCGDTRNPCNLDIKIERIVYYDFENILYNFKDDVEKIKDNIMRQKMDTLFNYISDKESVNKFKKELENYNTTLATYQELLEKYNSLHNNMMKQELIIRKTDDVYGIIARIRNIIKEYTSGHHDTEPDIEMVIAIYINELIPEVKNLQRLKYDVMETEVSLISKDKGNITHLYQRENAITNMVYTFDKTPKVVRFVSSV